MPSSFEGIYNFRDLGGLETRNGRRVKKGLLFRSGDLSAATESDIHRLVNVLGVKHIIDYREDFEKRKKPTPPLDHVTISYFDAGPSLIDLEDIALKSDEQLEAYFSKENNEQYYRALPLRNEGYKELMRLLQAHEAPLLQHCAAGKDRTGVGVFLTYLLLDVFLENAVKDYMLTEYYLLQNTPGWLLTLDDKEINPVLFKKITTVDPMYLFATFDEILDHYDTIDNYFLREFGITPEMRAEIQDFYLE